jgi:3-oxoacyl-[acyl-carrier protein] reductase
MAAMFDWSAGRLLITGGGSGLGLAIVEAALAGGAAVGAVDTNVRALDELQRAHPGVAAVVCDASDPESAQRAVESVWDALGGITCLVNCAGLIHSESLINLLSRGDRRHSLESWNRTLTANLTTTFVMTAALADKAISERQACVVINISSVSARGNPGQAAYSAAKAGVEAFTRVAAKELGPLGIRVVAIAPGFIDTPSTHAAMGKHLEAVVRGIPLRRLGRVEEVVHAVMAAANNEYLNGCVLALDGGL